MNENIDDILIKRLAGEVLSREEKACFDELIKIRSGIIASRVKERIDKEKAWNKVRPVRKISRMRILLKYVAIMILPLSLGFFLLTRENKPEKVK